MRYGLTVAMLLWACGPSVGPFVPPTDWLEVQDPAPVLDSAVVIAEACAARDNLPLVKPVTGLRFYRILAMTFDLDGNRSDFQDLPFSGLYWGDNVAVVKPRADMARLWAHELLHQLYGLGDGEHRAHPPLFYRCDLQPI